MKWYATAQKTVDLDGDDDLELSQHDRIRFSAGDWRWIEIYAGDDGLMIRADIGKPLTIEMSSSNVFIVKYP